MAVGKALKASRLSYRDDARLLGMQRAHGLARSLVGASTRAQRRALAVPSKLRMTADRISRAWRYRSEAPRDFGLVLPHPVAGEASIVTAQKLGIGRRSTALGDTPMVVFVLAITAGFRTGKIRDRGTDRSEEHT